MKYSFFACHGFPHSPMPIAQNGKTIWERCERCGRRWRWNIGVSDRIDNRRYLAAHIRDFCQPHGRTKKVYLKLYGEPKDPLLTFQKDEDN